MAKRTFRPLLGLTESGWYRIDYASTMLVAAVMVRKGIQMLGDYDMLGGASKYASKANFGLENKTWNRLDAISTALYAMVLVHGAVDAYEERRNIPNNEQFFPGKGLVYRGYEDAKDAFF
jgi:hypothetical protein